MPRKIEIPVNADVTALDRGLDKAQAALRETGVVADAAGDKVDKAFLRVTDRADGAATKFSILGGAVGDVSGGFEAFGSELGLSEGAIAGITATSEGLSSALMFGAGAADIMAVSTEILNGATLKGTAIKIKDRVATIAKATAEKAAAVGTKAYAAAQWILNAALRANPIGLIITAIIALGAALVLAYKKSETFRDIVNGVFNSIKAVVGAVIGWFSSWVPKVFDIVKKAITTYVNAYLAVVKRVFSLIKGAVVLYIGGVRTYITTVVSAIKGVFNGLSSIVGKVRTTFTRVKDTITSIFKGAVNAIIDAWNRIDLGINISVPGWVPGIGGKGFKVDDIFPDIPRLASGGITSGPTMALIGDNPGGREAIIPLDKYDLGGTTTVYVTVQSPVGSSPAEIGRTIRGYLDALDGVGGGRVRAV